MLQRLWCRLHLFLPVHLRPVLPAQLRLKWLPINPPKGSWLGSKACLAATQLCLQTQRPQPATHRPLVSATGVGQTASALKAVVLAEAEAGVMDARVVIAVTAPEVHVLGVMRIATRSQPTNPTQTQNLKLQWKVRKPVANARPEPTAEVVDVVDAAHAPARIKLAETQENLAKLKHFRQPKCRCPAWIRLQNATEVLNAQKARTQPLKAAQVVHVAHATDMGATAESGVTEMNASPAQTNLRRM